MTNDEDIPPDATVSQETVAERWGSAADAGFIALPNALVRAQARLGLSPNEVVVLLNFMLHWWKRDRLPRPRSTAIAKRSGLGHRTVQRTLQSLEQKGLIARSDGPEGFSALATPLFDQMDKARREHDAPPEFIFLLARGKIRRGHMDHDHRAP